MQRTLNSTTYVMKDREKKALLVISPIIIGSIAYGASIGFMVLNHMLQIMF
ncbi:MULTISPECIES: hypothetical protein [unclassified Lysinibacillus]|uniref:hypothetical protein n=1 Tax=unclassified Lysinibacillus TaxID=2636778 RepID=UPI00143DB1A7|nr:MULTISPECIES: hypothetical protein [unclassified Lysinibacillus]